MPSRGRGVDGHPPQNLPHTQPVLIYEGGAGLSASADTRQPRAPSRRLPLQWRPVKRFFPSAGGRALLEVRERTFFKQVGVRPPSWESLHGVAACVGNASLPRSNASGPASHHMVKTSWRMQP